jgi:hypothetical protein
MKSVTTITSITTNNISIHCESGIPLLNNTSSLREKIPWRLSIKTYQIWSEALSSTWRTNAITTCKETFTIIIDNAIRIRVTVIKIRAVGVKAAIAERTIDIGRETYVSS